MATGRPLGMIIVADSEGREELLLLFADREVRLPVGVLESVAAASADPEERDALIAEYFEAYVRRPRMKRARPLRRGTRCERRRRRARARAGDLVAGASGARGSDDRPAPVEQAAWSLGTLIRTALAQTKPG